MLVQALELPTNAHFRVLDEFATKLSTP